jgi:short-subunit dehydrogenase
MKNPFTRPALRADFGTVLITGASRGIGRAIALEIAPYCERLLITARSEGPLRQLKKELGGSKTKVIVHSLLGFASGQELGEKVLKAGGADTVILNAGISEDLPFLEATAQSLHREFDVNYFSALGLTQALLPSLLALPRPTLCAVSSLTASVPFPGNANYSASKAALFSWLRSLAAEHAQTSLRVCAILPGFTQTEIVPEGVTLLPAMTASQVAKESIHGLRSGATLVLPGWVNKVGFRMERTAPVTFDWLVGQLAPVLVPGWKTKGDDLAGK